MALEGCKKGMGNSDWVPKKGETFYTFGYLEDDLVQPLTWGADDDTDKRLLKEGRVFKKKAEAESAQVKWFSAKAKGSS
jgi:hypothetical protein